MAEERRIKLAGSLGGFRSSLTLRIRNSVRFRESTSANDTNVTSDHIQKLRSLCAQIEDATEKCERCLAEMMLVDAPNTPRYASESEIESDRGQAEVFLITQCVAHVQTLLAAPALAAQAAALAAAAAAPAAAGGEGRRSSTAAAKTT